MKIKIDPNKLFENELNELNICHKIIFDFRDQLVGLTLEKYYSYFEILLFKYLIKSISFMNLLKGSEYNKDTIFIDIPSLFIHLRSLIENYLTFYYLFVQPSLKNEIRFRSLIYQRSGLKNRQKYDIIPPNNAILIKEKKEIEKITKEIEINPLYNKLNSKVRNRIKDKATLMGFIHIIKSSPLKNTCFESLWRICSNYAHSEFISGIQFRSMYIDQTDPNEIFYYKRNILKYSLYLISLIINDFKSLFPVLIDYFENNTYNIKEVVDKYEISKLKKEYQQIKIIT